FISSFFFQAEDGIRDFHVTGVRRVLFRSRPPVRQGCGDCVSLVDRGWVEPGSIRPNATEQRQALACRFFVHFLPCPLAARCGPPLIPPLSLARRTARTPLEPPWIPSPTPSPARHWPPPACAGPRPSPPRPCSLAPTPRMWMRC